MSGISLSFAESVFSCALPCRAPPVFPTRFARVLFLWLKVARVGQEGRCRTALCFSATLGASSSIAPVGSDVDPMDPLETVPDRRTATSVLLVLRMLLSARWYDVVGASVDGGDSCWSSPRTVRPPARGFLAAAPCIPTPSTSPANIIASPETPLLLKSLPQCTRRSREYREIYVPSSQLTHKPQPLQPQHIISDCCRTKIRSKHRENSRVKSKNECMR